MDPVIILLSIVGLILLGVWAWSLAYISGPPTDADRARDDEDQIKFVNEYMRERLNKTDPR